MQALMETEFEYFSGLVSRYSDAVLVPGYEYADARAANCHDNAEVFVKAHPDHSVVRGWLLAGIAFTSGMYRIVAHSVVRRPGALGLIDVTPLSASDRQCYRFLEHRGTEQEFLALKAKFPELYFPPPVLEEPFFMGEQTRT